METKIKGYTKTTFGELQIGDTFNFDADWDSSLQHNPDFFKRVKVSAKESEYANGNFMFIPEDNWTADNVVFVKSEEPK